MSHFQRIGLAYRESDAIKKRITENPYAAKAHFIKIMIGIGLCLHDAEALLGAKKWNLRMELAWSFLEPAERKQAQSIDYDRCENYWPNLDFLAKAVGLSL
jgi:hypothetical protein